MPSSVFNVLCSWPAYYDAPSAMRSGRRAPPVKRGTRSHLFGPVTRAKFYLDLRCLWRIWGAPEYRLFRSNAAPPTEGDTPWVTTATLPVTPADTFANGTWFLAMSFFNGIYDSGFLGVGPRGETFLRLDVTDDGALADPPNAPVGVSVSAEAGGMVRVQALYRAGRTARADQWSLSWTSNGSEPPEHSPTTTVTLRRGLAAVLDHVLGPFDHGTTVKVRVQTRRNDGTALVPSWRYSLGSTVINVAADAVGPGAPVGDLVVGGTEAPYVW